jgi:hypothetical protein
MVTRETDILANWIGNTMFQVHNPKMTNGYYALCSNWFNIRNYILLVEYIYLLLYDCLIFIFLNSINRLAYVNVTRDI